MMASSFKKSKKFETGESHCEFTDWDLSNWQNNEEKSIVDRVHERQAHLIFYKARVQNAGSVLVAAFAAIAVWKFVNPIHLSVWLAIFILVYVWRAKFADRFIKTNPIGDEVHHWIRIQFIASATSAIAYGSAVWLFWPEDHPLPQLTWVICITAVTSTAVSKHSFWKNAYLPFICFAYFPMLVKLFLQQEIAYHIIGSLGLLYGTVLLHVGKTIYKTNLQNILMGVSNRQLTHSLSEEIKKVTDLNQQLTHEMEEREKAFSIIREQEKELEHAKRLEAIGVLSAGVAHEINTPLQYIGNNLQFIGDGIENLESFQKELETLLSAKKTPLVPDELRQKIESVQSNHDLDFFLREMTQAANDTEKGIAQISKIVQALRLHAGAEKTERSVLDLHQAIESAILLSHHYWQSVCTIETDFQDQLPTINCDAKAINQVIMAFLMNSIQAIQEKQNLAPFDGKIEITTRLSKEKINICIKDNGIGIPEEAKERIFEAFFTTKEVGKGMGQGLSVAHKIVNKHNGSIRFESEEKIGTCFSMELPIGSDSPILNDDS